MMKRIATWPVSDFVVLSCGHFPERKRRVACFEISATFYFRDVLGQAFVVVKNVETGCSFFCSCE